MDHIANTQIYTCYTISSNCWANTSVGCVYFFTSDSDWSTKEYVKDDVTSIYTHINGNLGGGKISNTYGLSITKDYVYYFYLDNFGNLTVSSHNDVYALPNNSASGELRGGQHKASVYTSTDDSTYAYDSDQTHGGDIQVGGFGWSTGYETTAKSYAVSSKSFSEGNYSYFNTPAKTSWITLRVNEVYDGYIFKGWYKNSALISEDSEYSYRVDDTNNSDIYARFYKPTYNAELLKSTYSIPSNTLLFKKKSKTPNRVSVYDVSSGGVKEFTGNYNENYYYYTDSTNLVDNCTPKAWVVGGTSTSWVDSDMCAGNISEPEGYDDSSLIWYYELTDTKNDGDWQVFAHLSKPSVSAAENQYDLGDTVVLTATPPSNGTLKSGATYNYYYTTDGGTTYYKIAENAGTSVNFYPPAIGMYEFLVTATDGAGIETVESDLSDDVQVGSVGYYVAGNTELTDTNWTQFSSKGAMTNDAGTHWTKTFTAVPAGTHGFRITDITKTIGIDGWTSASDYTLTGNGVELTTDEDNVQFTLNAKSKVTITFDETQVDGKYPVTVTVTDVVAVPVIVYAGKNGSVNVTYGSATTTIAAGKNETIQVAEGESINLRAVPAEGYSFNRWAKNLALPYQIEGANAGASISGETITKRTTYVAYFSSAGGDLDFDDSAYSPVSNVSLKYSSGNGGSTYKGSSGTAISGTIKQNGNNYWIVLSSADLAAWKSGAASGTQLRWNMFNSGNSPMLTDKSGTTVDVSTKASGVTSKMENYGNNDVFVEVSGLSDNITSLGILVDTTSKKVTYYTSASSGSGDDDYVPIVNFYAKDTIYYQSDGNNYEVNYMGDVDTTVTEVEDEVEVKEKEGKPWEAGTMLKGSPITVSTTIPHTGSFNGTGADGKIVTDLKADEKYFVTGFSFNGYTPEVLEEKTVVGTAGTTYTCTYVIPANMPEEMLEITPIFFIKDAYAHNTAKFYLNGYEDLKTQGWGNTLFIYPFYRRYKSGNKEEHTGDTTYYGQAQNFGGYPGQPVINNGGQLYTQIPLTNDGSPSGYDDVGNPIKGVTINNGYFDTVHQSYCKFVNVHKQTYDYDDFAKIYNEKKDSLHAIYFSFKFHPENTSYQHRAYEKTSTANSASRYNDMYADSGTHHSLGATTTIDALNEYVTAENPWEDLTDSLGNKVDLFGNKVDTSKKTVYAVSMGYEYNNSGEYATEWAIYTTTDGTSYSLVTSSGIDTTNTDAAHNSSIVPSALVMNDADSFAKYTAMDGDQSIAGYKKMYTDLKDYSGCPVKIVYDYDAYINYNNPHAYRSDGRWTYTTDSDFVQSKIVIEYIGDKTNHNEEHFYDPSTGTSPDAFKNTHDGTVTGCSAYFTNSDFYGAVVSKSELISSKDKLTFEAKASDTYEFVGWYMYDANGKRGPITTDSLSAETLRSGNFTLAARFKYIASGTLTISNKLASDMTGRATTYLGLTLINGGQETVVKSVNTNTEPYTFNSSIIKANSNYVIKVDIRTVPSGENKFVSYACNTTNGNDIKTAAANENIYKNDTDHGRTTGTATYYIHVADYLNGEDTVYGDIFNDDNQVVKAIEYVSTLNPVTYAYSVKFNYTSRQFGDQAFTKEGTLTPGQINDKTVVTGTLNKTDNPDKKLTKEFLAKLAPHESNFNEKITWDFDSLADESQTCTYDPDNNTYTISLEIANSTTNSTSTEFTTQRHGYFTVPYELSTVSGDNGIAFATDGMVKKAAADQTFTVDVEYDDFFKDSARKFVTAPTVIYDDETPRYFKYWEISTVSGSRGDSRVIGKCYFPEFNYRALDNYNITAVYSEDDDKIGANAYGSLYNEAQFTTIDFIGNTRNQWNKGDKGTSSNNAGDLIYNDFILTFKPKGNAKFSELTGTNKCGFVIQRLKEIEKNSSGTNAKTLQEYAKDYTDLGTAKEAAKKMAGGTKDANYTQINVPIAQKDINDKNRCHNAYSMWNSKNDIATANAQYLYRAYSYMQIDNGEIIMSDTPTYFYMYDIAQQ